MSTNDIGSISELMRVARATNFEDMIWFTRTYYQITMRHLGIEGSVSIDGEAPNSSFKLVSGVTNIFLMGNVFQTGDMEPRVPTLQQASGICPTSKASHG